MDGIKQKMKKKSKKFVLLKKLYIFAPAFEEKQVL